MRWMVLLLMLTACAGPTASVPPTPSAVPRPSTAQLTGTVEAVSCARSGIVNVGVQIKDQDNSVIGSGTTRFTGDENLLAYEKASQARNNQAMGLALAKANASDAVIDRLASARAKSDTGAEQAVVTEVFGKCVASFEASVPTTANFYQVQVGNRPAPTYSRDDLVSRDWHLELSLGD